MIIKDRNKVPNLITPFTKSTLKKLKCSITDIHIIPYIFINCNTF
ncbi:hypothetical protein CUS_7554 [Ruminococcus albus 8]|uniref:Uncharacterized protein n=1 Tax=Ruminococcus albus 8 TaxID=246199 RepID=E9SH27_RUMAL|nr:hypothetical protein CUS_7554 [Ruminococcus albus 8]